MNAPPTSDSEAPGTPCWPLTKPQKKTIYIIMCVCVYLRVYTGNNTNTRSRRISHWEKWKEKKLFFFWGGGGRPSHSANDKVKRVSTL